MLARLIRWSTINRPLVLLVALLVVGWGIYAVRHTPLDAIPDLSDVQVIIKTTFPGQSPQVMEDQVTYPLTTAMLGVPGSVHVRGYSFFGESYVYVIFQGGTDPYWARTRVLEYLSQARDRLPAGARTQLGPDASGVGWIYEYALVDRSNRHDLSELRGIQDWFLKFELQTVPGVAEVASVGGMVKQYQVVLDPGRMRAHALSLPIIRQMILDANQEVSGSVIEMGEAEYLVRGKGYIRNLDDLKRIPYVTRREAGAALLLQDIADIRIGPQMRRGIADLDGEGEVAGGIVVMRAGSNAKTVIAQVKDKLEQLKASLPEGVEVVETYDRSALIGRAVATLERRLAEEFILVAVVCAAFLFHLRSSLVVVFTLPVGILAAFVVMHFQGINANIMSLGGIAIALGAMVDAAIVMIENVHKRLEREPAGDRRLAAMQEAMVEVGPPLFFSLLIITFSFLPVFALQAQEGRLFAPLAYTKTFAMAAAAGLSVTLVPVLIVYLVRGRIRDEKANPLNRTLIRAYRAIIDAVLRRPGATLAVAGLLVATSLWPLSRLGSEFMPRLDEGDLLYMPTTLPGLSAGKAQQLLQQTDRLIRTVPEVDSVFGKIGQAETATDPAPLTMIETTIRLKPRAQWREGMTLPRLIAELDERVRLPGLTNSWQMPIAARIDMLATGIKTPLGVKVAGPDLRVIDSIGAQIEGLLRPLPGTASVYAERTGRARYVEIDVDRDSAAHYGLSVADIYGVIAMAVGGENITYTVEGRERYPINVRYPSEVRNSLAALRELPVFLPGGQQIRLADVADVAIKDGPEMIKSEDARLNDWVYVDIQGRDLGSYVADAQRVVANHVRLPAGYSIGWSGQYQYLARASERLRYIVPLTLVLILLLLYLNFRNMTEALMVMGALPLALVGGVWLLFALDYRLSVAVGVGFIALAGVAAEFGVVMLVYLDQAVKRRRPTTLAGLHEAVIEGAALRVRPKAMTVAVVIAALLPIMLGGGTGSEVMRRIAAPMIGGMVTAPLVSMLVIPVLYVLWKRRRLGRAEDA
ncbi:MAG TPA: CusA/CzcA family heavy metal efflux RND transporter [Usitatibacter sp.]|nr:CusA/CzcA family heavy metal efflux RND transporter [Usitatibacter sp.]